MRAPLHLVLLLACGTAAAQTADEADLALAYGDAATVSVATGSRQSVRRAPAVASVFTAEDIRAMGAHDLGQVLERVPGMHVSRSYYLQDPRYQIRGVQGDFNQQTLLLIDGVRHQSVHTGGHGEQWINMPADQIARVEVIRGPGSALHGADAVAGVVSVTTVGADPRQTPRVGVQWSGDAERSLSVLGGGQIGDLAWSAYFRGATRDGAGETVQADAQTALDAVFRTRASLAPGPANTRHRDLDANLRLVWGAWDASLATKRRYGAGSGVGLAQALSPDDSADTEHSVLAVNWHAENGPAGWDLQAHASLTHTRVDSWFRLFPKGAFGGQFPDGMIGAPGRDARMLDVELGATYSGLASHRLRLGAGARDSDLYAVREQKNFNFAPVAGIGYVPVPLGALVDVSTTSPYINPVRRRLHYVLVQDEWNLAQDWDLTVGIRSDQFSDFGATTNPRLALVWDARHDLTVKLLHGRAFRAPAFTELHTVNNPVALGNPTAQPERMATSELALDWQAAAKLHGSLNLFHYRMSDILRAVPNAEPFTGNTFANLGEQVGRGLETEWRWKPHPTAQLVASYSYQDARDGLTDAPVADAPRHMVKLGLDWSPAPAWGVHVQARHAGGRQRAPGDTRAPVADADAMDLALRWNHQARAGWSATLSIHNLLDRDLREPSPAPGSIPFDFPLPGRQVVLQTQYRF